VTTYRLQNTPNSLRSTYEDVVNWDVDEFHEVSNEAHDSEANCNRPANVQVLFLSGFCAPCQELVSVTDELLGNFDELLDLVGHAG